MKTDFDEAITDLCVQMRLTRGVMSKEGGVNTCPIYHYTGDGYYSNQVIGSVIQTPDDDIMCYLMVIQTLPRLPSGSRVYVGRWSTTLQSWEISDE